MSGPRGPRAATPARLLAAAALVAAGLGFAPRRVPVLAAEMPASPAYGVAAATAEPTALLAGDEVAWAGASVVAWGPAPYETRFRAAWAPASGLFLRFDADDPSPWHTMTRRDEQLWDEEVVEIFLDLDGSGRDYYELEINPANVVCDLRMIAPWPDKKGDLEWNLSGLETRVLTHSGARGGTRGWTATAFLPWSGLRPLPSAARVALPPKPGDAWRFNVFRIERPGGPQSPERDAVFAAWSPPSVPSFHDAGAFRPLVFSAPR